MKQHLFLGLALMCLVSSQAYGRQNHHFLKGPFKTGPDVTKACLECHTPETKALMKTVHWNWSKKQTLNGKSVEYGKKNALNNHVGALPSNWRSCTGCHAGYGWVDADFDFSKPETVDCLICHETTGAYKKFPTSGGHPVYQGEIKQYPAGKVWEPVDLVAAAQSVERPTRAACGNCHFYGCWGDNVKHGDLDSSLADPTPEMDIHMGGKGMTCESCHKAPNHDVRGEAISVSLSSGPRAMSCGDCHKGAIHKSAALNFHIKRVACQTCHIPTYARTNATLLSRDWSTAGKDLKPEEVRKDASGRPLYERDKGDLSWGKNLVPTYAWYNGAVDRVMMGDKIDPSKVVKLTAPKGERQDPNARIFPFKIMKGKQPYDAENMTVAVVETFSPYSSQRAKYDWNKAIEKGMKAAGQPYSGKYGWVETSMAWSLNHMVAPKAKALSCPDCHVENGRLDWPSLGYPKDPR